MKINFQNVTNIVHDIKIVGKGLSTVYSYQRLGKTTKLRNIKRNPRFFIRDIKNRMFGQISVDGQKYKLKKKTKKFYLDTFSRLSVEKRNKVIETFQKVLNWVEKDIRKHKYPLDIGGFRYPIVKDVYITSIPGNPSLNKYVSNLIPLKYETTEGEKEVLDGLDSDFRKRFYKNFGVGEIWGKKVRGKILSVWVAYIQASDADVYRSENDRFFIVEHYVQKEEVSKKLDLYSKEFRFKLFKFVIEYGKSKGRFIKVKKSELPFRSTIGIVGWYPITQEGMKYIQEQKENIKRKIKNEKRKIRRKRS